MREINKISESLFEKIRDRFEDVSLGDENAKATQNPEDARFFNFDYVVDGKNYGNITISLIDESSLKVYFSKNISHKLDEVERKEWYGFLRELREFAKRNILSFEPRDITRSTLKHRDLQQVSKADSTYTKDEVISEGRMWGSMNRSYEDFGPVRIKVAHSKPVIDETNGARSRNIAAIFVENDQGERFRMPFNSIIGARAMARHISAGGTPTDEFGQHIAEMVDEMLTLRPFVHSMKHRQFEDAGTNEMLESAFEYHGLLKNTLKKMKGKRGYNEYKETYQPALNETDDYDQEELKEKFVKKIFPNKLEAALPIVHKAHKMKQENANPYLQQFESWASRLSEGTWAVPESEEEIRKLAELMQQPIEVGVDAENATSVLYDLIGDDGLYDELLELAQNHGPEKDARGVIRAWVDNHMPELAGEIDYRPEDEMSESSTGDTPIEHMSRAELLDYLNVSPEEVMNASDDELRAAANERAETLPEGVHGAAMGGVDGVVHEDDDGMTAEDLYWIIHRRIMSGIEQGQHTELLRKLGPEGLMDAMQDYAEFHAGAEEWGSSDTSGVIRGIYRRAGIEYPDVNESIQGNDYHLWTVHFEDGTSKKVKVKSDEVSNSDLQNHFKDKKIVKVDRDYSVHTDHPTQPVPHPWTGDPIPEEFDPGKISKAAKNAIAGAALAGATTLGYLGGQDIEHDPYIAKLEQQYQQASKAAEQAAIQGDQAKAQQLLKQSQQLKLKIHDAEAAAEMGVGGERGTAYNKYEDIAEMRKLAGL